MGLFSNNEKTIYEGEIVDLIENYRFSEQTAFDGVPVVYYAIRLHGSDRIVGKCDLRLKMDDYMYYYGHVGYSIHPEDRGHHYALEACKVLFRIAKEEFSMNELYITCNPDNDASYKTLTKLNGKLIEVARIPENHELYRAGNRYKCIFLFKIDLNDGLL